MADVTKFKTRDEERPSASVGESYDIIRKIDVVSGDCPQNDNIVIQDIPAGHQVVDAAFRVTATLGASCTATLRVATTAITAATTAAEAHAEIRTALAPFDASAEQTLNLLIEGAAIAATATFYVFARVYVTPAAQL